MGSPTNCTNLINTEELRVLQPRISRPQRLCNVTPENNNSRSTEITTAISTRAINNKRTRQEPESTYSKKIHVVRLIKMTQTHIEDEHQAKNKSPNGPEFSIRDQDSGNQ